MQRVIADNLKALMEAGRHGLKTQQSVAKAAREAGYSIDQKSVSRVLRAEHAPQVDTVQALAAAYDIEPYQLLIPGLDPKNPQILRQLSAAEAELYRALEVVRHQDEKK